MTHKLTEGGISRQLISLTVPLFIGNILQQLYHSADAIIIGRFAGDIEFAAIGVAGTVMNLFIFLIGGACGGIAIVMASLYGAGDMSGFRRESFISTVFGLGFAVALSAISVLLLSPVLNLISTPDVLVPYIKEYLLIILGGMPAIFIYNLCAAALRSIGDTRRAALFLAIAVALNVLLDLLLVGAFGFGMAGAAWATVISQLVSAALCIIYIKYRQPFLIFKREDARCDKALLRRTVKFASISALNQSSLYIGKLLVQGVVNGISIDTISGFTAASRIEAFSNSVGVSGGEALSVFVAQNMGAGRESRAREGFLRGLFMLAALGAVLSVAMYLPAVPLVGIFVGSGNPGPLADGAAYLRLISVFYVICMADCAFLGWNRGSGELDIFMAGTILQIVLRVSGSWLLAPALGIRAIALATGIGWSCLVVFKTVMYFIKRGMPKAEVRLKS